MLSCPKPNEAYRQSSFEARLLGSSRNDLIIFCLEDFLENLVSLELADARGDSAGRSRAITRSITALTALELGLDRQAALSDSLAHLYSSAKNVLLNSVRHTDKANIAAIKRDFSEIAEAFRKAAFQ